MLGVAPQRCWTTRLELAALHAEALEDIIFEAVDHPTQTVGW